MALETGLYAAAMAIDQEVLNRFPSQRLPGISLANLDRASQLAPLGVWLSLRQDAMAASDVRHSATNRLQVAGMVGYLGGDWPQALTLIQNASTAYQPKESIQHARPYLTVAYPSVLREKIDQSSRSHEVSAALFYGIARQKSLLYPGARSSTGALGVLQFLPDTFHQLSKRWQVLDSSAGNACGVSSQPAIKPRFRCALVCQGTAATAAGQCALGPDGISCGAVGGGCVACEMATATARLRC